MDYKKALSILQLPELPTRLQIKKSYRELALKYHPDRNPEKSAQDFFLQGTAAYRFLIENFHQLSLAGSLPSRDPNPSATVTDLDDIFDDIFGFSGQERILGFEPPQLIRLTPVDLAHGLLLEKRLAAFEKCPDCQGMGAQLHSRATICTHCFGAGRIQHDAGQLSVPPTLSLNSFKPCHKCLGRGRHMTDPCQRCDGYGRLKKNCRQQVTIPPGLVPGQVYIVPSKDSRLGKNVDLFISPELQSQFVTSEGPHLYSPYLLDSELAKKGGELAIPTLWGWSTLTVPPRTTSSDRLIVPQAGLWKNIVKGQKGDWILSPRLVSSSASKRFSKKIEAEMTDRNPAYGTIKRPWWKKIFG